jgi:phage regulator Rha-like protein
LAELYGVTTGNLKRAVKRNLDRFPDDFMFQLTLEEYRSLRFQIGILEKGRHSKYPPYAFTEQGVAMLSSILRSKRAVQVNIEIMRTFVRVREMASTQKKLVAKLNELEAKFESHDQSIQAIFRAIQQLMAPPERPTKEIGFKVKEKRPAYGKSKKTKKKKY